MIIVRFKVQCQPERAEQVQAALHEVIAPSRALDGVISFDIGRDLADPNSFIATEVFEDRAALDRQESQAEVTDALAVLGESLVADPEATISRVAQRWSRRRPPIAESASVGRAKSRRGLARAPAEAMFADS